MTLPASQTQHSEGQIQKLPLFFDRARIRGKPEVTREPPAIVLQERDYTILETVWRYHLLDTYTLSKLIGHTASDRVLRRRLLLLWVNEFLERPRDAHVLRLTGTESHSIVVVGRQGYYTLAPRLGLPLDNYQARRQRQLAQEVKWLFMAHRLGLNRFHATLELATKAHEYLRLLSWTEEGLNVSIRDIPERQLRLFPGDAPAKVLRLVPDGLVGLEHSQEPPGRNRSFYFVEFDNGTSPLTGRFLTKKGLAYAEYHRQGLSSQLRGFRDFNTLVIVPGPTRARNMMNAFRKWLNDATHAGMAYPPDLWWFTDKTRYDLDHPETILGPIWQTVEGEARSLLD